MSANETDKQFTHARRKSIENLLVNEKSNDVITMK
jgi:hypothetical protein